MDKHVLHFRRHQAPEIGKSVNSCAAGAVSKAALFIQQAAVTLIYQPIELFKKNLRKLLPHF
jgi:hypothetical protein